MQVDLASFNGVVSITLTDTQLKVEAIFAPFFLAKECMGKIRR
jgi:hypothetical protein